MPLAILYNIVCDECGEIANPSWLDSGLECFRWASSHAWSLGPGALEFNCPDCKVEVLEEEPVAPPGFVEPDMWCSTCETGRCPKCQKANRDKRKAR